MRRTLRAWVAALIPLLALSCAPSPDPDASDARRDGAPDAAGRPCRADPDCDDGVYCNGAERCDTSRCLTGPPPCDDRASCTVDACDESSRACAHAPEAARCDDGDVCDGAERCEPAAPGASAATGCAPAVRPLDCDDRDECTLDRCDPRAGCAHGPRDIDGDGHVERACTVDGLPGGPRGDDCNDGDATVHPGAVEMCADGRDNDCDGRADLAQSSACSPSNDVCATATVLPGAGSYLASTVGLRDDYALSCNPGARVDAAFVFTLTTPQDVTVSIDAPRNDAALALTSDCALAGELRCVRGAPGASPVLRVRALAAGTYRILAETGATPAPFRLTLRYDPPGALAADDACPIGAAGPAPVDLADGAPHRATLAALGDDHSLSCNAAALGARDAVFRLTLGAPADVRLAAVPAASSGPPGNTYLSLRDAPCAPSTLERACRTAVDPAGVNVLERALPAGTYWVIVEHSNAADVTVTVNVTNPPVPVVTYTATSGPAGVAFIDACALPGRAVVLTTIDDAVAAIPAAAVPFPVRLYGVLVAPPYTVSSNGYLALAPSAVFPVVGRVPDPSAPNLTVAAYWSDVFTRAGGVCYGVTGTAPDRALVVAWNDAHYCCTDDPRVHLTFELVVREAPPGASNVIDVVYNTMSGVQGMASAGVENDDGSDGTSFPVGPTSFPTLPRVVRLTPR